MSSEQLNSSVSAKVIGFASLVLLIVTIAVAFITGNRKSARGKIEKQLSDLRDEAVAFDYTSSISGNLYF